MLIRDPIVRIEGRPFERAPPHVKVAHLEGPSAQGTVFLSVRRPPQRLHGVAGGLDEGFLGPPEFVLEAFLGDLGKKPMTSVFCVSGEVG